jgi:hypothetical protein
MPNSVHPSVDDNALAQYNLLIQQLTLMVQSSVTTPRILVLLATAVRFLLAVKGLTEPQVANLALCAIKQVINDTSVISQEDKDQLLATIEVLGDSFIYQLFIFAADIKNFVVEKTSCLFSCKKKSTPLIHARAQTLGDYAGSSEHSALLKYVKINIQKPFTEQKLIDLLASAVTFMAYYKNLAGLEKKDMVLTVVREVISSSPNIEDDKRQLLLDYVDLIGNQTVDLFIQFGRDVFTKNKSSCMCS